MAQARSQHAAGFNPNKPRKAQDKYSARRKPVTEAPIGWDEVDPQPIAALVYAVTNAGDAVTFGRTTDGGALSVCILTDGPPHKEYYQDADQAERGLRELTILSAA